MPLLTFPIHQRIGPGITVRGRHYVHINAPGRASRAFRSTQHAVFHEPVVAFTTSSATWSVPTPSRPSSPFPENIGLLTLQHREQGVVLLRLQHLFGVGEDAQLSQPAKVSLADIFSFLGLNVAQVTETSLTANQPRADMHFSRMRWNGADAPPIDVATGAEDIVLTSLQVRTFLLQLA